MLANPSGRCNATLYKIEKCFVRKKPPEKAHKVRRKGGSSVDSELLIEANLYDDVGSNIIVKTLDLQGRAVVMGLDGLAERNTDGSKSKRCY